MKRLFALMLAVVALCGCRGQAPPATDPFLGRTRIAPPATGAISSGPADPYYRGSPGTAMPRTTVPPQVSVPQIPSGASGPPAASGGGSPYAPSSGTIDFRGSSLSGAGTSIASRPAVRVTPPSLAKKSPAGTLAGRERVIRIIEPRPKASAGSLPAGDRHLSAADPSAPVEPRRLNVPARAVDIMDLPAAGTSRSPGGTPSASQADGVRLVSGARGADDSGEVTAAVGSASGGTDGGATAEFTPRAGYGHDPEYAWLRGKLEYSQIDRRWKLRYIPVDGETDKYGGSVLLPDASVLAGCERGDFVEVRGRVGRRDLKKSYAPTYEVAEIERFK